MCFFCATRLVPLFIALTILKMPASNIYTVIVLVGQDFSVAESEFTDIVISGDPIHNWEKQFSPKRMKYSTKTRNY